MYTKLITVQQNKFSIIKQIPTIEPNETLSNTEFYSK